MATLYVVSTPIGNLGDLTLRASEVLGTVARVLCEDTRRTRILVGHLGIRPTLVSLHEHNEVARTARVLAWMQDGEDLALVSDAGTPLISDPGARLVAAVLEAGHEVIPVPGPSAVTAALVASGLPSDHFAFLGFPPRKGKDRKTLLARVADSPETVVLFESAERLDALLADLVEACGPRRRVAVARELTKLHEDVVRGTLAEARSYYREVPPRGEITVVIGPSDEASGTAGIDPVAVEALARALLAEGLRTTEVAAELARRTGLSRNEAYRIAHSLSD